MATDTAVPAGTAALADQIRVAVPGHGLRHDLRAAGIVWRRELIRFRADRLRAVTALIQPVLFLFVLGPALSSLAGAALAVGRDRPGHGPGNDERGDRGVPQDRVAQAGRKDRATPGGYGGK